MHCRGSPQQCDRRKIEQYRGYQTSCLVSKKDHTGLVDEQCRQSGEHQEGETHRKGGLQAQSFRGKPDQVRGHAGIIKVRPIQVSRPHPVAALVRDQVDPRGEGDPPEEHPGQNAEKQGHGNLGLW